MRRLRVAKFCLGTVACLSRIVHLVACRASHSHQLTASETESVQFASLEQLDLRQLLVREVFVTLDAHLLHHMLHPGQSHWLLMSESSDGEIPLVVWHCLVTLLESTDDLRVHVNDVD